MTATPLAGMFVSVVTAVDISSAGALLAVVLDVDSFRSWDSPPRQVADWEYREALARAALRSGADEAIITGEGLLAGRRVAVMCSEFAFMGGSIGTAAAHRIVTAVRRATASRLPLLASAASGGTRMQEGAAAFTRTAPIVLALTEHKAAGLPYLVHLRNPATGGVFASWASLGHITVAEPGALVGFLGPSVFEALNGEPFPPEVQTAQALFGHGLVDAVLPTRLLAGYDRDAGRSPGPADLRTARRGLRLAAELRLPFVSVIDTDGAELSPTAEWGGLAGEIARCLADLQTLSVPTLSVLLGQGAGGAAIALLPADRVLAARHAWLCPLPPEGAAMVWYRDTGRAPEVADAQHVRAADLRRSGVVDRLIDERPDAADEPVAFASRTASAITYELAWLCTGPEGRRVDRRDRLRP
ncbi:carboxyl transferase domain-containing protein [Amycolatopsis sp.]|uniref:carboxyl transferase domain-containing protein n=1 Tax=Amycolatopsis sp. TaxID=37632 RepID=UPI00261A40EB|nr:carboxyl transferase domain-containing protein [Amycolatopsis sp.]